MGVKLADAIVYFRGDRKPYDETAKAVHKDTKAWTVAVGNLISSGVTVAAQAAAKAVVGIGKAGLQAALDAMPIQGIRDAFQGITENAGETMQALRQASLGMVTDANLMRSYNEAFQLVGKSFADQLPDAMTSLRKVAAATKQDMGFMLDSLTKGVGRLSPMILDNLGIQVSLAEATERASQKFGLQADALDKAQIQAGMMEVVLEKLAENTANMPDVVDNAATTWAQFQTTLQNLKDAAGEAVLPVLMALLVPLNDLATEHGPRVVEWAREAGEWLGRRIPVAIDRAGTFITRRLLPAAREVIAWIRERTQPAVAWVEERLPAVLERIGQVWRRVVEFLRNLPETVGALKERLVAFVTETDWLEVGRSLVTRLVDSVVAFVRETDWGEVGRTILDGVTRFFASGGGMAAGLGAKLLSVLGVISPGVSAVLGPVLTGIRLFSRAWVSNFAGIRERIPQVFEFLVEKGRAAWDWITGTAIPQIEEWRAAFLDRIVPAIETFVRDGLAKLWEVGQQVWSWIEENALPVLEELWRWFGEELAPLVSEVVTTAFDELWRVLQDVWTWVQETGIPIVEEYASRFREDVLPVLTELKDDVLAGLWTTLQNVWGWIQENAIPTVQRLGAAFRERVLPVILDLYENYLRRFYETGLTIWTWIAEVAIPTLRNWAAGFRDGLQPHIEAVWRRLQTFYEEIQPRLQRAWDRIQRAGERLQQLYDEHLAPALQRLFEALGLNTAGTEETGEAWGDFVGWMLEVGLEALLWAITEAIEGLADAAEGAVQFLEAVDGVLHFIRDVIEDLLELWDDFTDRLEDLSGIELPEWLQSHSPPPLANALREIAAAARALPDLNRPLGGLASMALGRQYADQRQYVTMYGTSVYGAQSGSGFLDELMELARV